MIHGTTVRNFFSFSRYLKFVLAISYYVSISIFVLNIYDFFLSSWRKILSRKIRKIMKILWYKQGPNIYWEHNFTEYIRKDNCLNHETWSVNITICKKYCNQKLLRILATHPSARSFCVNGNISLTMFQKMLLNKSYLEVKLDHKLFFHFTTDCEKLKKDLRRVCFGDFLHNILSKLFSV